MSVLSVVRSVGTPLGIDADKFVEAKLFDFAALGS